MVAAIAMAVGAALKIAGDYASNIDRAISESANAEYFRRQANFARISNINELRMSAAEHAYKRGQIIGSYAGQGLDVSSGSVLGILSEDAARTQDEQAALRMKGDLDVKLAMMRGEQSERNANKLSSDSYNLTQAGTTLITSYAASEGFGTWDRNPATGNYGNKYGG